MRLVNYREFEVAGWTRSKDRIDVFLQALHDTTRAMVQPLDHAMVLDVFYATMILSMLRRICFESYTYSSQAIFIPTARGDGSKGSDCVVYLPIILVLESTHKTLTGFCNDICSTNFFGVWNPRHLGNPWLNWSVLGLAQILRPISGETGTLAEELNRFIDRVELR